MSKPIMTKATMNGDNLDLKLYWYLVDDLDFQTKRKLNTIFEPSGYKKATCAFGKSTYSRTNAIKLIKINDNDKYNSLA